MHASSSQVERGSSPSEGGSDPSQSGSSRTRIRSTKLLRNPLDAIIALSRLGSSRRSSRWLVSECLFKRSAAVPPRR